MKIAIKGHKSRGKEVIRILENLGGINRDGLEGTYETFYYIDVENDICDDHKKNFPPTYKFYTLEEFEKEFPFKIGDEVIFPVKWASGKVTGLTYREGKLKYEVDNRISGYHYVESHKLSLYPMKEERNITLTLDKAKEWYKKGGDLKQVALQTFTEKELNPLPRSWEEFCDKCPIQDHEAFIDYDDSGITLCKECAGSRLEIWNRNPERDRSKCVSEKSAEAHLAMIQLEQLRNYWWGSWKPIWGISQKWCIRLFNGVPSVGITTNISKFLTFPTKEIAEEFLECFRDLIEKAGDLI